MFNRKTSVNAIVETGIDPLNKNPVKAIVGEGEVTPLTPEGKRRISWLSSLQEGWENLNLFSGFSGKYLTSFLYAPSLSIRREEDDKEVLVSINDLTASFGLESGVSITGVPPVRGKLINTTPVDFWDNLAIALSASQTSEITLRIVDNAGELLESNEVVENDIAKKVFQNNPHPVYIINNSYETLHITSQFNLEFWGCQISFHNITFRNCEHIKFDNSKVTFSNCVFMNNKGLDLTKSDLALINSICLNPDLDSPVIWVDNSELDLVEARDKKVVFIQSVLGEISFIDRSSADPSGTNNTSYFDNSDNLFLIDHNAPVSNSVQLFDKISQSWETRSNDPLIPLTENHKSERLIKNDNDFILVAESGDNPNLAVFNYLSWTLITPDGLSLITPNIEDLANDKFLANPSYGSEIFYAIKQGTNQLFILGFDLSFGSTYTWINLGEITGFTLDVSSVVEGDRIFISDQNNTLHFFSPSNSIHLIIPRPLTIPYTQPVIQEKITGANSYPSLPPDIRQKFRTQYINLPLNSLSNFPSFVAPSIAWVDIQNNLPSKPKGLRKHPLRNELYVISEDRQSIYIKNLDDFSVSTYAGSGTTFLSDLNEVLDIQFLANGDLFILDKQPDLTPYENYRDRLLQATTSAPYTVLRDYLDITAGGGNNLDLTRIGDDSLGEEVFMNQQYERESPSKVKEMEVKGDSSGQLLNLYLLTEPSDNLTGFEGDYRLASNSWLFVNDTLSFRSFTYSNQWLRLEQGKNSFNAIFGYVNAPTNNFQASGENINQEVIFVVMEEDIRIVIDRPAYLDRGIFTISDILPVRSLNNPAILEPKLLDTLSYELDKPFI